MLANKTVWWFVVHGSEGDLAKIEQAWDKVQSQTLWTLQDCYMPANSQTVNESPTNTTPSLNASVTAVTETSEACNSSSTAVIVESISTASATVTPTDTQQEPNTPVHSKPNSFF